MNNQLDSKLSFDNITLEKYMKILQNGTIFNNFSCLLSCDISFRICKESASNIKNTGSFISFHFKLNEIENLCWSFVTLSFITRHTSASYIQPNISLSATFKIWHERSHKIKNTSVLETSREYVFENFLENVDWACFFIYV